MADGEGKSLRRAWESSPSHPPGLSSGLRNASAIRNGSATPPPLFPFRTLRRVISSLGWPSGYRWLPSGPREVWLPKGFNGRWATESDDRMEIQGVVYDDSYLYLVTTTALWAVKLSRERPDKPVDLERDRAQWSIEYPNDVQHMGRRQLFYGAVGVPIHLGAPCIYQGKLIVPAEGATEIHDVDGWPNLSLKWVWVFDTTTLGFLGRIAIPVEPGDGSPPLPGLAWCFVDPETRLLYTSDGGDDVRDVYVYHMPSLDAFTGPPADEMAIRVAEGLHYPSKVARFAGRLHLLAEDGSEGSFHTINGGAVTPSGHLYLSSKDDGLLGFDLITGRQTKAIEISGAGLTVVPQGIDVDVLRDELHLAVWVPNIPGDLADAVEVVTGLLFGAPAVAVAEALISRDAQYTIMHLESSDPSAAL